MSKVCVPAVTFGDLWRPPAEGAELSVEEWRDSSCCSVNFPVSCAQMALCSIRGEVRRRSSEGCSGSSHLYQLSPSPLQEHLLGLSDRSHLYAGDTEVGFRLSRRWTWRRHVLRSGLFLHSWPPTCPPSPSATTSCSSPRTRTAAAVCI